MVCFKPGLFTAVVCLLCEIICSEMHRMDLLTPYVHSHGSRLSHRAIRECQEVETGPVPHELYPSQVSRQLSSVVSVKRFMQVIHGNQTVRGHFAVVSDPMKTVSVLEPKQIGGCKLRLRQCVPGTSKQKKCLLAVNAGYFNTRTGECLGNVVSDGRKVQDSHGIQNAHFGIKVDGKIFTGYVSEEELHNGSGTFQQLVGGVIWLVRNGTNFVNTSKYLECEKAEETGPMDRFVGIRSARTAVGHDRSGRVVIVHVDGKSDIDGINLWDFQTLLVKFGVVNAINLDGGGSSTFVINGTVVNYPSDDCPDGVFSCVRNVSTVLCVHDPECDPSDCNGHGKCIMGRCSCDANWLPPTCIQLSCGSNNCSGYGICTEEGCRCNPGFYENCNKIAKCGNSTSPELVGCLDQLKHSRIVIVALSILTALSIGCFLIMAFYSYPFMCTKYKKPKYRDLRVLASALAISDSSDSESIPMSAVHKR